MKVPRALVRRARAVTLAAIALGTLLRLTAAFPAAPLRMAPGDEWFYWDRSEAIQLAGDPENAWQPPLYSYAIAAWRAAGVASCRGGP